MPITVQRGLPDGPVPAPCAALAAGAQAPPPRGPGARRR